MLSHIFYYENIIFAKYNYRWVVFFFGGTIHGKHPSILRSPFFFGKVYSYKILLFYILVPRSLEIRGKVVKKRWAFKLLRGIFMG
jgi:hypothetical protein